MPKTRSSSGRRRMSRWPVALVLGLAAGTPALSALVAGCSSGGDDSSSNKGSSTTTESVSSSGQWPASEQTTEALNVVTWRATEQSDGSFKLDGLDTDANVAWTINFTPTADGVSFVSPGGQMDVSQSAGVTQNTLDAASKYGLAALSFDLQASGFTLPDQGDLELTNVRGLITGGDGGDASTIVTQADSGLLDGGDASLDQEGRRSAGQGRRLARHLRLPLAPLGAEQHAGHLRQPVRQRQRHLRGRRRQHLLPEQVQQPR